MKATELIRWALEFTDQGTAALVADMHDAAMTPSTPGAPGGDGNHTLWCLGHMAFIEASLPQMLLGAGGARRGANRLEHWASMFGPGSRPSGNAADYPPFEEVLAAVRSVRRETLALLEEAGEAGLDRTPANIPPGFEQVMTNFARAILLLPIHQMVHYGQIADCRRVAGRRPMM